MGGDSHHKQSYDVPSYKIYKVEDVPELLRTQEMLQRKGLCDPWLRNEVWRFDRKQFGTEGSRVRGVLGRGLVVGIAAAVATIVVTEVFARLSPTKKDDHGDAHH